MFSSSLVLFPFFGLRLVFLLVPLLLYFLPSFLARDKQNFTTVLLVNLFLGWTVIGWVVALVLAISSSGGRAPMAAGPAVSVGVPQVGSGGTFFCSGCGKVCVSGQRFCSGCGAALPVAQA